jgi:alkanesulfonate monooxygenase SsuD/methylene tetrahydromethanopterin reductase-like flavin-dependent oxidoreductase (luciferase family)
MTRPFRFIAGLRHVVDRATLEQHARGAEAIGYHQLCIHDHLTPQLGPIPMLTAAAMATTRLRVCPLVLNYDFRHPAVLAQDFATLDIVSDGRARRRHRCRLERAGIPGDRIALRSPRLV